MSDNVGTADAQAVRAVFGGHGHWFHYAAVKEITRLHDGRLSPWAVDATEFPVEVQGIHLHIDIILRTRRGLIVLECKRSNRALSQWAFARSALTATTSGAEYKWVRIETAVSPEPGAAFKVHRGEPEHADHQYNVALEVKTNHKGDP